MYHSRTSPEEFYRLAEGRDKFVRIDIAGPGNLNPEFMLPKRLERDTAIVVKFRLAERFHSIFQEYSQAEYALWATQYDRERLAEREKYIGNICAANIMVFRDDGFLYRLSNELTTIAEQYNIDIRLYWKGKLFIQAHEYDPKFEIPTPTFQICALCNKRFIPSKRGGMPQEYCIREHREKARFRRAYLRRKKRQGRLSEVEGRELHGLE